MTEVSPKLTGVEPIFWHVDDIDWTPVQAQRNARLERNPRYRARALTFAALRLATLNPETRLAAVQEAAAQNRMLPRGSERDYLLARAIQFFLPGIPQVYYVGLLAGRNDLALLQRTGVGRDINRHHYTRAEIDERLRADVVQQLLRLIELRNAHPAFNGQFEIHGGSDEELRLAWTHGEHQAELWIDFKDPARHGLRFSGASGEETSLRLG